MVRQYKDNGVKGLISKKRGAPGNHKLERVLKELAIGLIEDNYNDFCPTVAQEKLKEVHGLKLSVSTVRTLMIKKELWNSKRIKKREYFNIEKGEAERKRMMQMDGLPHDWVEGRAAICSLIYTIDDATGEIMTARFELTETTEGYFCLMKEHVKTYGRRIALYTDKPGDVTGNHKGAISGDGITQFGRAMKELEIKLIYANTPQAKRRIERMNQTLRDLLVEEANSFLPIFINDFNHKFAVVPKDPNNAHKDLLPEHHLSRIFTIKENRTLKKI